MSLISPFKRAFVSTNLCRQFTTSLTLRAEVPNVKFEAEKRQKNILRGQTKRAELKRVTKKRTDAKTAPENRPLFLDIPTALRYLRASEVGRSPNEAVITLTSCIYYEKGAIPLQGSLRLPKALKETRILVFTEDPEQAEKCKEYGAIVVDSTAIPLIQEGKFELNFDRCFATTELTKQLQPLSRILGPKGLLPNVRRNTLADKVDHLVLEANGTMPFKQKRDLVSVAIGRCNYSDQEIIRNIISASNAFREALTNGKPKKPSIIGKTTLTSTHGPGIVINF